MKKVKLIIAAVSVLSLVSSSAVYADGFAPGEGLYIGGFGGHGSGIVQPKVTTQDLGAGPDDFGVTTGEMTDGGLGLSGVVGGAWVGYGYKMGPLYVGFEWDFAGGGEKFKATCTGSCTIYDGDSGTKNLTQVEAEVKFTTSGGGRIGYYLNSNTLLALRGGIAASKFDVKTNTDSSNYYGGGPAFAASLQSTLADIDPNLSMRLEYLFVDYMTAAVTGWGDTMNPRQDHRGDEVTGQLYQGRIGLAYSFFDVNSLF